MPKLKTNKSALKRFKITKKKVLHRHPHQNHFNAKQSGQKTRQKRGYEVLPSTKISQNIKKILPYA